VASIDVRAASVLGWAFFRLTALLPERLRAWALHGTADTVRTLAGVGSVSALSWSP
jgi:hypothetical protein